MPYRTLKVSFVSEISPGVLACLQGGLKRFPVFFRHPITDLFYVFLPPTRPRDVIYDVNGLPRSTSETPRRRPTPVVYVRVLIRDSHNNAIYGNVIHIHGNAMAAGYLA